MMRSAASGLVCVLISVLLITSPSLSTVAAEPRQFPQSSQAQLIVEQAEEIFHVHPERAEKCISLLDAVMKGYAGTHQAAVALAYLSYGNEVLGNADAAMQFRQQLEREYPESLALGELLLLLAEKAEAAGDFPAARSGYVQVIALLDKHLGIQAGLLMRYTAGRCLAQLLDRELALPGEAVAVLKETATKFPGADGQASAWRLIADIAARDGGRNGVPALGTLEAGDLPELDAESRAAAMLGAARLRCEQSDFARSASILHDLRAEHPGTRHAPAILLQEARITEEADAGNIERRLALWLSVIRGYPDDPRCATAYMQRANLFLESGQVDRAIVERMAGRDNAALLPVARGYMCVALGDIYRDEGRNEEALTAYQQGRRLGGGTPAAWTAVRRLEAMGVNPWPGP